MGTIKIPTSISLAWWKKNVPDSLPASKKIEDLLKRCEAVDMAALPKLIPAKLAKLSAEADLGKIMESAEEMFPPHDQLLEELKRFKVTVTKAKHVEFDKALTAMIELVRTDKKIALGLKKKLLSNDILAKKDNKGVLNVSRMEGSLDIFDTTMKKLNDALGSLGKAVASAKSASEFEKIIGTNRFMQAAIKKMRAEIKELASSNAVALKDKTHAKLAARVAATARLMEMIKGGIDKLDKESLAAAMKALGDKAGKTLFMAAKPVKLNLK